MEKNLSIGDYFYITMKLGDQIIYSAIIEITKLDNASKQATVFVHEARSKHPNYPNFIEPNTARVYNYENFFVKGSYDAKKTSKEKNPEYFI